MSGNNEEYLGSMLFDRDPGSVPGFSLTESASGRTVTFEQLTADAHSVAKALIEVMKLNPDDMICIMSDSSIQTAVCLSACTMLNVAYILAGPTVGWYHLAFRLRQTESRCLFASRRLLGKVKKIFENPEYADLRSQVQVVSMDNHLDTEIEISENFLQIENLIEKFRNDRIDTIPFYRKPVDSLAGVIYTSGSTGVPKGTGHTNRSLMTNCRELAELEVLRQFRDQKLLLIFPLMHVSGSIIFFMSLYAGTPLVLFKYEEIDSIFDVIHQYQIGQIFGSGNAANRLVKDDEDLSSIKLVLSSGCKMPINTADILVNQYGIKVVDSYGSTETLYISVSDGIGIPTNVGKPLPSFEIKVIKNDDKSTVGEICFRGPCLFREYYRNPEETARVFDSEGWFHTGDIGYLDDNGRLHVTDRIKEVIKFDGFSVYPAQIECFLMSHQAVRAAVVVPVPYGILGQAPRAYVALEQDSQITAKDLEQYVNENLGYEQQLRGGIIILEHLRYTSMGKIDRHYFKQLSAQQP